MRINWNTLALMLMALVLCSALSGCGCGEDDHSTSSGQADDDDQAPLDDDFDDDDDDADDDVDDDAPECDWATHDPLIVEGKQLLGAHDPEGGYDKFALALERCPDSADARYGIIIADVQWYVNWFNEWINFLMGFNPAPHRGTDKSIGTVIQTLIRDYMMPINDEIFTLGQILLEEQPEVRFYLASLPMWLDGEHVTLDMAGEWDLADVKDLLAFAHLMESLGQFLLTYDFTFNYNTFAFWPPPEPGATIGEIIHSYSGLILDLLNDPGYPDFLTFLDGGPQHLSESAVNTGAACLGMVAAFEMARLEIDPQEDDVLGYIDKNGNGRWDEGEPYHIPYFGDLTPELNGVVLDLMVMLDDLGDAFLDGGPEDTRPLLPDWFLLSRINFILEIADLVWYELLGHPLRFMDIPIPIGPFFYNPPDDGIRSSVGAIAQVLYDATAP